MAREPFVFFSPTEYQKVLDNGRGRREKHVFFQVLERNIQVLAGCGSEYSVVSMGGVTARTSQVTCGHMR